MRRTTKIIIGVFTGILLVSVLLVGLVSRSGFIVEGRSQESENPEKFKVDISRFKVIRMKSPGNDFELSGELVILGSTGENSGTLLCPDELKSYLKQEVSGDTLTISLQPVNGTASGTKKEIGPFTIVLYAGSNVNLVNEWPLATSASGLKADSLTLQTFFEVSLDGCRVRYSSIKCFEKKTD